MNYFILCLLYDGFYQSLIYLYKKWLINHHKTIEKEENDNMNEIKGIESMNNNNNINTKNMFKSLLLNLLHSIFSVISGPTVIQRYCFFLCISILIWHIDIILWTEWNLVWFITLPPVAKTMVNSHLFQKGFDFLSHWILNNFIKKQIYEGISFLLNSGNRELLELKLQIYINADDIENVFTHSSKERLFDLFRLTINGIANDYLYHCWTWKRFLELEPDTLKIYQTEIQQLLTQKEIDLLFTPTMWSKLIALYNHTDHHYLYKNIQQNITLFISGILRWNSYCSFNLFLPYISNDYCSICSSLLITYFLMILLEHEIRQRAKIVLLIILNILNNLNWKTKSISNDLQLNLNVDWSILFRVIIECAFIIFMFIPYSEFLIIFIWLQAPDFTYEAISRIILDIFITNYKFWKDLWILSFPDNKKIEWYKLHFYLKTLSVNLLILILWCRLNLFHLICVTMIELIYLSCWIWYRNSSKPFYDLKIPLFESSIQSLPVSLDTLLWKNINILSNKIKTQKQQ